MKRYSRLTTRMLALLLALLGTGFAVSPALAQPSAADKAAAEALFQRGKALMTAGSLAEACEKLAASYKLEPAVGTLLFLGDCYERSGKTASAWATFEEAASLAERQGQRRRKEIASVRAAALQPQLSSIAVTLPQPVKALAGLQVRRNGLAVPSATWNTPLPVDPGEHAIEVTAPGHERWSTKVTVPAGGQSIRVAVPTLQPSEAPAAPAVAAASADVDGAAAPGRPVADHGGSAPAPLSSPASSGAATGESGGNPLLVTGVVLGSVGVAGLVLGSVFGLMANGTNEDSLEQCRTATLCSPAGLDLREDAQAQATVSTVAFVAGGVLLASGVTLLLVAPSGDPEETGLVRHLELAPAAIGSPAGLSLRGSW